jgi:hypothetical protein
VPLHEHLRIEHVRFGKADSPARLQQRGHLRHRDVDLEVMQDRRADHCVEPLVCGHRFEFGAAKLRAARGMAGACKRDQLFSHIHCDD